MGSRFGGFFYANPDNPPDLRHTKLIQGAIVEGYNLTAFNPEEEGYHEQMWIIKNKSWNDLTMLLIYMLICWDDGYILFDQSIVNVVEGQRDGYAYLKSHGYRYDLSVQNYSAQDTWKKCLQIAKEQYFAISVVFQWQNTPKAQHPNAYGILRWVPGKNWALTFNQSPDDEYNFTYAKLVE
jgi:hypothetical protein